MTDFQEPIAIDWTAVDAIFDRYRDGVRDLLNSEFGGAKAGVVEEVLLLHEAGVLTDADGYGLPLILRVERGYPVSRGYVDLMLFHVDGSGTVIMCNPGRTPQDVLPSVGQAISNGVQVGMGGVLKTVRVMIASRASGDDLRPITPTLKRCGVEPIFCGQFAKLAAGMADVARSRIEPVLRKSAEVRA